MKLVTTIKFCLILLSLSVFQVQAEDPAGPGVEHYKKAQEAFHKYAKHGAQSGSSADPSQLKVALVHIEKAVKAEPKNAAYHQMMGQVLERSGDKNKAFYSYRKAYDYQPVAATAAPLAMMALNIGKTKDAIEVLQAGLANVDPYDKFGRSFRSGLVSAYILNDQFAEAEKEVAKQKEYDHSSFARALSRVVSDIKSKRVKSPDDMATLNKLVAFTHIKVLQDDGIAKSLDGRKWAIGFEDENKQQYVREYYLEGDTPSSWNEVVIVQILKGINMSLQDAMKESEKIIKKKCPDIEWTAVKSEKDRFAHIEWQNDGSCKRMYKQFESTKMVALEGGVLARIAYTNRTAPVKKDVKKKWQKLIADISLQQLSN